MQIQFGTLYNGCTVVLKICILYCGISLQEDGWTDGQRDMLTLIFAVLFSSVALPIASFDIGYIVCTSLVLRVNVPNAYKYILEVFSINKFKRRKICVRKIPVPIATTE